MANLIVYYSRKGENYWASKRIIPFCTNEGSGMGGSEKHLKKVCPEATIEKGLSIAGNQAANAREKAVNWARQFA